MILITGATGKSGSATARALNDLGHSYRALIRNPEKEEELKALGAEVVIGSIEDNQSLVKAMSDVEKVLILLPNSENQLALEKQIEDTFTICLVPLCKATSTICVSKAN